jgi:hypothetical protein
VPLMQQGWKIGKVDTSENGPWPPTLTGAPAAPTNQPSYYKTADGQKVTIRINIRRL